MGFFLSIQSFRLSSYEKRHRGPVWQLRWYELERSEHSESFEALLSISSDGRIVHWTLRKEFETTGQILSQ